MLQAGYWAGRPACLDWFDLYLVKKNILVNVNSKVEHTLRNLHGWGLCWASSTMTEDDEGDEESEFKVAKAGSVDATRLPNRGCGWTLSKMFVY